MTTSLIDATQKQQIMHAENFTTRHLISRNILPIILHTLIII